MSSPHYNYDITISPCASAGEAAMIKSHLQLLGYDIDDHLEWLPECREFAGWAKDAVRPHISEFGEDEDHHAWIVAAFPGRRVITRWRCVEYDEWDSEFDTQEENGEPGEENEGTHEPL